MNNSTKISLGYRVRHLVALAVVRCLFPQTCRLGQPVVVVPLAGLTPSTAISDLLQDLLATELLVVDPTHPTPQLLHVAKLLGSQSVRIPKRSPLTK